jgi:hypothetical protein
MKQFLLATLITITTLTVNAQDDVPFKTTNSSGMVVLDEGNEEETPKEKLPFKKHLFVGGSANVSFFNGATVLGLSPYFGYSFGNTLDVAIQTGYTYTGQRDFDGTKYRQNVITAGAFARLFLLENVFLQGGYEQNYIGEKAIFPNNAGTAKNKYNVGSFLVGGGYSTGRSRDNKVPFYFVSILFDVTNDPLSPYTQIANDGTSQAFPIITAGLQIPLFQGNGRRNRNREE